MDIEIDFGLGTSIPWKLKDYMGAIDVPYTLSNKIGKTTNNEFIEDEVITGLSKINILVGANNSGKSYIMREILKSDLQLNYFSKQLCKEYNLTIQKFREDFEALIGKAIQQRQMPRFSPESFYIRLLNGGDQSFSYKNLLYQLGTLHEGVSADQRLEKLNEYYTILSHPSQELETNLGQGIENLANSRTFHIEFQKLFKELIEKLKSEFHSGRRLFHGKGDTTKLSRIYFIEYRNLLRKEREELMQKSDVDTKFDYGMYWKYFKDIDKNFTDIDRGKFMRHGEWQLTNQVTDAPKGTIQYTDIIAIRNGYYVYDDLASWFNSSDGLRRLQAYQEFLSQEFFQGKDIILIPARDKAELLIKIGNEPDLEIYHLGTGLQMMIMFTLPLFQYDEGIFFIEEPELYMHPGMQRHLMSIFATHERTKNFVFFMTTHSNHIIDASMGSVSEDISTFTVRKFSAKNDIGEEESKFSVTKLAQGNRDALSLLGVLNSSVYLANCTIWVEGVTDRFYLAAYIRAFLDEVKKQPDNAEMKIFQSCLSYREGTHYAFVFSGGNNIVHWDFDEDSEWKEYIEKPIVKEICGRALVIVDRDIQKDGTSKAPKRKAHLTQLLGERFIELSVNEMENLLSLESIEATLKKYPSLQSWSIDAKEKDKLRAKLAKDTTKIGNFLDAILTGFSGKKPVFGAKSGTTKNKVQFCEYATETITYDNMTKESRELVEKVLTFVMEQNR